MNLVLFDVDGTLVNVRGSGRWSLTRAFEATFGLSALDPIVGAVRFDGRTDPAIIAEIAARAGIAPGDLARRSRDLEENYLAQLRSRLTDLGRVEALPGCVPLIQVLARRRIPAGLLTGNTRAGAMLKLSAAGLDALFEDGAYGSDGADRAELGGLARERFARRLGHPIQPEDVIVIGDAPEDVRAARENGFRSIAVATGWTSPEDLREEGPDLLLADLSGTDSILAWIERGAGSPAEQGFSRS